MPPAGDRPPANLFRFPVSLWYTVTAMRQVKAVIFDVGGTLVEGAMPWYDLYQRALVLAAHPLPARQMVACYEAALRHMMADRQTAVSPEASRLRGLNSYLAAEFELTEARLQHAVDEVIFDYPEARHLVCAEGVHECLTELQARRYRLAVISNWSADLPRVLSQLGIRHHFEAVFASEALGYAKPNPAAFLVPLDRLGLTAGTAAYVGDLYDVDVVGARDVGMTPILVDPLGLGLHDDVTAVTRLPELLGVFTGS